MMVLEAGWARERTTFCLPAFVVRARFLSLFPHLFYHLHDLVVVLKDVARVHLVLLRRLEDGRGARGVEIHYGLEHRGAELGPGGGGSLRDGHKVGPEVNVRHRLQGEESGCEGAVGGCSSVCGLFVWYLGLVIKRVICNWYYYYRVKTITLSSPHLR